MVIVHCLDKASKLHVPPFKLAQLSIKPESKQKMTIVDQAHFHPRLEA